MQNITILNSGISTSCIVCGTKNVRLTLNGKDVSDQETIDKNVKVEYTACPHFEGYWTNEGVEVDKNGIIHNALNKENDIMMQMVNLVNPKCEELEKSCGERKEISKSERDEYWIKINTIIKEGYAEIGWPQNVPVKLIKGNTMVHSSDILKKQLDDTYVMLEYNEGSFGMDAYYLYHFDPDEE